MTTGSWTKGSAATSSTRKPGAMRIIPIESSGEYGGARGATTPSADCSVGPVVGVVVGRDLGWVVVRVVGWVGTSSPPLPVLRERDGVRVFEFWIADCGFRTAGEEPSPLPSPGVPGEGGRRAQLNTNAQIET